MDSQSSIIDLVTNVDDLKNGSNLVAEIIGISTSLSTKMMKGIVCSPYSEFHLDFFKKVGGCTEVMSSRVALEKT